MRSRILGIGFFILLAWFSDDALAGITGTIAGRVVDSTTGEPLPGVNVLVVNTPYGAATDAHGRYLLHNIKPGIYRINARMIGYALLTQTQVRVRPDSRTVIDFELVPEALSIDREIVVTAPRELIRMDVTGTQHDLSGDLYKSLPVTTPEEALNLQPGVVEGHIRGGRKSEVLYLVDGMPVQEATTGERAILVPNISIADLTIQTGGFNAEYGNAMSGVVNIITHEGGDRHRFYVESSSDHFGRRPGSWDGIHFDRFHNLEVALGGPLKRGLRYYVSTQLTADDTPRRRAFEGVFSGPVEQKLHGNAKLSVDFHPTRKLVLQGLLTLADWHPYEHRWVHNLQGLPARAKDSFRFNLGWTHLLSDKTFYTLRLSHNNVLKSVFGRDPELYDVHLTFDPQGLFVLDGDKAWWQDSHEIALTAKIDITSQIDHAHQLKSGVEMVYYDLYMDNVQIEPFPPNFHPELPPEYRFNVYNTKYRYFPKMGSFYVQDKYDLKTTSINAGLRFDFIDPAGQRPAIESFEKTNSNEVQVFTSFSSSSIKAQWSPRVGISFPLSSQDKFHINYGHFFQVPLFEYLYTNLDYNFSGYNPLVGNPDLSPEKTEALEIGYEYKLTHDLLVSITAFNKDISNLVDVQYFQIPVDQTGLYTSGVYTRYVNLAYGSAKGIEFFMRKKYGDHLRGHISYTLMEAKGSSFAMGDAANILQYGGVVQEGEFYLSWDQRHTLILNIDYQKNLKWGANLVWRINSPKPYTLDEGLTTLGEKIIVPNNRRLDWTRYLDLKLKRHFRLGPSVLTLQVEVRNLLDNKNLLWRDVDGRIGGLLADPGAYDVGRRVHLGLVWSD
ncbi:TonB-dependent receptor [candidate division KSB1 bacterium]|nr:TonB-dependent receptor [candidate division KSB1 bacterium]